MASPGVAWRGYVNQILYGEDLRRRVEDEFVARITEELIRQRIFTRPVEDYYQAAVAALGSGERLSLTPDQDEHAARDLLSRLVKALDERRPWPEPPFYQRDPGEWPELRDAPVIAHIPQTDRKIRAQLNRVFTEVATDGDQARVLILRLRTGQTVALRALPPYREPGVALLARTDPATTVAAFRELTGIDTES